MQITETSSLGAAREVRTGYKTDSMLRGSSESAASALGFHRKTKEMETDGSQTRHFRRIRSGRAVDSVGASLGVALATLGSVLLVTAYYEITGRLVEAVSFIGSAAILAGATIVSGVGLLVGAGFALYKALYEPKTKEQKARAKVERAQRKAENKRFKEELAASMRANEEHVKKIIAASAPYNHPSPPDLIDVFHAARSAKSTGLSGRSDRSRASYDWSFNNPDTPQMVNQARQIAETTAFVAAREAEASRERNRFNRND